MQESHFDADYYGQTTAHPLGLAAIVLLGSAMLMVPRRYAVWPVLIMACFVPPAQRVVIGGLDFTFLRIMVVFGWMRLAMRGDWYRFHWHSVDTCVLLWPLVRMAAHTMLHGNSAAMIFQLGGAFDALGIYFLFRMLFRSWIDVDRMVVGLIFLSFPLAVAFAVERSTGRNLFAFFGGVPEITTIREGRLRCQGAFAHPILAGCFWAGAIPMIAARLWNRQANQIFVIAGLVCSLGIIFSCASSTPVVGVMAGAMAGAFFLLRYQMRVLRWGLLLFLVALHFIMKAPVWHLISRIDVIGGSTGYHRYRLIDAAIRRFGEWWMVGTKSTAHWGHNLYDVTNGYVLEAVQGGVFTLILFVALIGYSFRRAGQLWRAVTPNRTKVIMAWGLGAAMFVHSANIIAVSYFGQIWVLWYLTIAALAGLPLREELLAQRMALAARREARFAAENSIPT